ncbi:RHS repeat domain-containing protein [Dysgonomonas sp. 511]|uniref:RHS repeat domain-containing protein n=1 Tax=Dysgonomonas sp. 511 TaxID=2302930 RepID=UPI0013D67A25|nr:RHS repeat-associated core domain-containing protein [Dysgonomonas sp. 511]NDV78467.1 hypothetical protein [Dysgonomonas sp. 511]
MGDLTSLHANGWQTQYQRDLFGLEIGRTMQGGLSSRTTRDRLGRVTGHGIQHNNRSLSEKSYLWGINDQLLQIDDNGKQTKFSYDTWGNLSKTIFPDGKIEHRNPDKTGNLFESLDRMDRKYAKGGQLVKAEDWTYKYDKEGNLKEKKGKHGETWEYYWNAAGMLSIVKRPDGRSVLFTYDALGRRTEKHFARTTTKFVWDGNVPLHEWREVHSTEYSEEEGQYLKITKEPVTTWVFEEGTFVPTAKLVGDQEFSIVTNYLGTPEAMYDEMGSKVWSCTLDSYGKVRNFEGQWKVDCPFRYQGQYEDSETGLYYNRFRYYSPEEGMYISQDPIRIIGGLELYSYVKDTNTWVDRLGLIEEYSDGSYQLTLFPTEPYNRQKHYGNTPTAAQKSSVPAGMEFDHDPMLVKHYYEGVDGSLPGYNMTNAERRKFAQDINNGKAATPKEQRRQGAKAAAYSKKKKKQCGF